MGDGRVEHCRVWDPSRVCAALFGWPGAHVVWRCLVGARLSFCLRPRALVSRDFLPGLTAVDSVHPS